MNLNIHKSEGRGNPRAPCLLSRRHIGLELLPPGSRSVDPGSGAAAWGSGAGPSGGGGGATAAQRPVWRRSNSDRDMVGLEQRRLITSTPNGDLARTGSNSYDNYSCVDRAVLPPRTGSSEQHPDGLTSPGGSMIFSVAPLPIGAEDPTDGPGT